MSANEKLEHLASKHEFKEAEEKREYEQEVAKYSGDPEALPEPESKQENSENAAMVAAAVVGVVNTWFSLLEPRIKENDKRSDETKEALAPAIEKHNLSGLGAGPVVEIRAGWNLVLFIFEKVKALKEARKDDGKKTKHSLGQRQHVSNSTIGNGQVNPSQETQLNSQ